MLKARPTSGALNGCFCALGMVWPVKPFPRNAWQNGFVSASPKGKRPSHCGPCTLYTLRCQWPCLECLSLMYVGVMVGALSVHTVLFLGYVGVLYPDQLRTIWDGWGPLLLRCECLGYKEVGGLQVYNPYAWQPLPSVYVCEWKNVDMWCKAMSL